MPGLFSLPEGSTFPLEGKTGKFVRLQCRVLASLLGKCTDSVARLSDVTAGSLVSIYIYIYIYTTNSLIQLAGQGPTFGCLRQVIQLLC